MMLSVRVGNYFVEILGDLGFKVRRMYSGNGFHHGGLLRRFGRVAVFGRPTPVDLAKFRAELEYYSITGQVSLSELGRAMSQHPAFNPREIL